MVQVKPVINKKSQYEYTMDVLNLINVAREIRAGHGKQLAENIENSLPEHLKMISKFKKTPLMKAPFLLTNVLYISAKKQIPRSISNLIKKYGMSADQVLSDDCYDLLSVCGGGRWCWPLPTSLRPVDVDSPNPYGWHYIVGSGCGWNLRGNPCGEPVTGAVCSGNVGKIIDKAFKKTTKGKTKKSTKKTRTSRRRTKKTRT